MRVATNSSSRVKTSFTGRFAARASAAVWGSKWPSHLAPKPPPMCGTLTRTAFSGSWSVSATSVRAAKGTCVDDQICTLSPCHSATMARGSIGTPDDPSATKRLFTTTAAVAIAASASPLTSEECEASFPPRRTRSSIA